MQESTGEVMDAQRDDDADMLDEHREFFKWIAEMTPPQLDVLGSPPGVLPWIERTQGPSPDRENTGSP